MLLKGLGVQKTYSHLLAKTMPTTDLMCSLSFACLTWLLVRERGSAVADILSMTSLRRLSLIPGHDFSASSKAFRSSSIALLRCGPRAEFICFSRS